MIQRRWLAVVVLIVLAGCVAPAQPITGSVEVLGTWTGAELAAFNAVIRPFEERTGVSVEYVSTRDLRGELERRLAAGDPPDLVGLEGPAHLRDLAARGVLVDLAGVLDVGRYRADVAPTFIELGTIDGHLSGVFVRSAAKGLIWYSPRVFRLGTPRTWEELGLMALQASSRAEAEWCLGLSSEESSGWPGTDLIEQFLIRASGRSAYDAWVAGQLAWTSPEVRQAFESYLHVVADGAVYGGPDVAIATDFRVAGESLFSDPPGCLFMPQGSFMQSFFAADGLEPETDYDFFAFPDLTSENSGIVIGAGDLFGVITEKPAAAELMRHLVSDEAQSIWVAQGGSLSVKTSVMDYPDPVSRRAAELLTSATVFRFDASDQMADALNRAFWRAVLDVTADPSSLDRALADLEALRLDSRSL